MSASPLARLRNGFVLTLLASAALTVTPGLALTPAYAGCFIEDPPGAGDGPVQDCIDLFKTETLKVVAGVAREAEESVIKDELCNRDEKFCEPTGPQFD